MGVGDSTTRLLDGGATVIGIDRDPSKLYAMRRHPLLMIVVAEFTHIPLRSQSLNIIVFYFSLHEVDPARHYQVLLEAKRVASKILIVEPSPKGCPLYEEYARVWREAMKSIGLFEEYKPVEYWVGILREAGFRVAYVKRVKWRACIPLDVLREIIENAIATWRRLGVSERYLVALQALWKQAKRERMKWSDIYVILAVS